MKHIFLINPVAGRGKASVEVLPAIVAAVKEKDVDYEIHRTVNEGDAFRYVRARCVENPDADMRFYACGGDGTMNEVLGGLYGFPKAQLGVIPAGTGNDFVRNFPNPKRFKDIEAQLDGSPVPVDVLRYELLDSAGEAMRDGADESGDAMCDGADESDDAHVSESERGREIDAEALDSAGADDGDGLGRRFLATSGYALNMFNAGFDAEVVEAMTRIKGKPLMNGSMAYIGGVGLVLAKLKKLEMAVDIDGKEVAAGEFLLAAVANGRFSGGGFDGCPMAVTDDGEMDVIVVSSVTRRFFLSIVKKYHDGTHIGDPRLEGILAHYRCKEAVFRPKDTMVMAKDGETYEVGAVKFSIIPRAIMLSMPAERA